MRLLGQRFPGPLPEVTAGAAQASQFFLFPEVVDPSRKNESAWRGKTEKSIWERCLREMSERKEEHEELGEKEKGFNLEEGAENRCVDAD